MEDTHTEQSALQRISDAAAQIFAEVGFAGARVDEIAKRANVNKATIYYHIGGKETLYAYILQQVFENLVTGVAERIAECHTPEEKLKVYIRSLSVEIQSNPHLPVLMMREFASDYQHLPETIFEEIGYLIELLTGILKEGEQQNAFIHCSPLLIHFMIIGANIFSTAGRSFLEKHNTASLANAQTVYRKGVPQDLIEDIETLVMRAVKKVT